MAIEDLPRRVRGKRRDPSQDIAALLVGLLVPGFGHILKGKLQGVFWFLLLAALVLVVLRSGVWPLLLGVFLVHVLIAISAFRS